MNSKESGFGGFPRPLEIMLTTYMEKRSFAMRARASKYQLNHEKPWKNPRRFFQEVEELQVVFVKTGASKTRWSHFLL